MNTRLGKSFGLAFVVAVGILALMLALGTFNAPKALAQDADGLVQAETITINPDDPAPGATGTFTVTFRAEANIEGFESLEVELEGFTVPTSIDRTAIHIRFYGENAIKDPNTSPDLSAGFADDVSVSGNVITLSINEDDSTGDVKIPEKTWVDLVFRQRAGLAAPAQAGTYAVSVAEETNDDAVTVSPALSIDPGKGGGSTEITVSGKAFADGTGSLWTEVLTAPDFNNDGIIDTLIAGTSIPKNNLPNGWGLSGDGGDATHGLLLLVEDGKSKYVAVPLDGDGKPTGGNDKGVTLGYEISLALKPIGDAITPVEGTPTIDGPTYFPKEFLKDVTVDDGAFSTTILASDLKIGGEKGRSRIRMDDADGNVARAVFQVTGTVALGSDSIRKGTLLKISLSDWIAELPNEVTIGGVIVADATDDAYDGDPGTDAGDTLFLDNNGNQIEPPEMKDLDDGALDIYVKVLGDVRLGDKTVVLFDRDADEDEQRLNSANVEITASGLTVSPSSAVSGQEITVEGRGFSTDGEGQLASITVGGIPQTELSNNENVDDYDVLSGGRVVLTFVVPAEVTKGDRTIQVIDDSGRVGEVALTVPEPTITLNPQESRRGTTVNVSGTGFPANESVTVDHGDDSDVAVGRSDGSGNWSAKFRVPSSAEIGGSVDVEASATVDDGNDEGDADTTYSADTKHSVPDKAIDVTPEQVQIGDAVEIVGTGFPRYGDVEIKFAGGEFRSTSARTDENGDFTHSATVPGLDAGTHVLQIRVNDAGASFVLDVVDTPISTIKASADAFADLVTPGNLIVVWHFDNTTKEWSFYDPRPAVAAAVDLKMVSTGDNVWIQITADQTFQGEMLTAGWNLVTLD